MPDLVTCPPDDPRLTSKWGAGIHRLSDAPRTVCVALVLMDRKNDRQPFAISLLTPAQAREMALALCRMADDADRTMNAALQPQEDR